MPDATTGGVTSKMALTLGFGATLALWLLAGYHFTRHLDVIQRDAAAVNRRFMEAQELLADVRTQVLLESLYVRDALLDPQPRSLDVARRRVRETAESIDRALQRYVPILDSRLEHERVAGLRSEIASFTKTLFDVLATEPRQWREQAPTLLNRIMPKRDLVMQISDEVRQLNRSAFELEQRTVAGIYAQTRARVRQTMTLALLASLAIALFAIRYVTRLERVLRTQRQKERQNTDDLQRLSTRLVNAQEEERRTIARELHDEVGQVLLAMRVELELARRRLEAAGVTPRMLDDAQELSDAALHTIRDLSHLLHPAALDDLGLAAALQSLTTGFSRRHEIPVEFLQQDMDGRFEGAIEAAAYRIVQEALTNVAKHAQATLAFVYVQRTDGRLQVAIEDDGVGFVPAAAQRGLGLIGIRERVAHLCGELTIDSAPGQGTRLMIALPAWPRRDPPQPEAPATELPMRLEVTVG